MPTKAKRPKPQPPKTTTGGKEKAKESDTKSVEAKPDKTVVANTVKLEIPVLVRKFAEWEVESGEQAEQHYDNDPLGILKEFPKVSKGGVKEAHLESHLWWWRKANADGAQSIFRHEGWPQWTQMLLSLYQDHFELSAYFYELRARFEKRYAWDFGYPWICCSRQQRRMLDCLWPNPYPAQNWLPSDTEKTEWQQFVGVNFNLKLNNTVLTAQFTEEIERLRRQHGIRKPAPGEGVRRKPMTWRPIELLDIRRYGIRELGDAERSQVSKAVVAYEAACRETGIEP